MHWLVASISGRPSALHPAFAGAKEWSLRLRAGGDGNVADVREHVSGFPPAGILTKAVRD